MQVDTGVMGSIPGWGRSPGGSHGNPLQYFAWKIPWAEEPAGLQSIRCRAAQLTSIRQMSGQVSRGSAGDYQADEWAGVAWLSWRLSGR